MKSKAEPRTKRRGRKKGDGILKEIDPKGSALENAQKLAYGRNAGDPVAELVRTWRGIAKANQDLAKRKSALLERVAGTPAPTIESLNTPSKHRPQNEEEQGAMDRFVQSKWAKWAENAERKLSESTDAEATRYRNDEHAVQSWLKDELSKLTLQVRVNMEAGKADWFRRMADAIEMEVTADGQDVNRIEAAVLMLGQMRCTIGPNGVPSYTVGAPLDERPRHTVPEICETLEAQGHRPQNQTDADWQRTVRRACNRVGVTVVRSRPGPKAA